MSEVQNDNEIILKVADLIERGSDGMQQITGHYFKEDMSGCCALGACYKGLGYGIKEALSPKTSMLTALSIHTWPRIQYPKDFQVPFAANEALNTAALPDVVIFLNDQCKWSFSKIVDYLRDCTLPKATTIKVKK